MKKITIIILSIFISATVFGQNNKIDLARKMLKDRGEVYFSFSITKHEIDEKELLNLSRIISIDKVDGNNVTAYANKTGFNRFLDFNYDYIVLTPPSMLYSSILENATNERNTDNWDYYPNWEEYLGIMNQFTIDYPNLCELVSIGTSINGKDILCIHINNNLGVDQNEPEFLYTSSIHGDELVGYILTLRLIDYLLTNYTTSSEVAELVNNIDIWINPLANPDGTFAGGNNSVWGATRFNANNVDLNRNYADPEDGPHPDGNAYQAETIVFMDFADNQDFVMSANMHGGAEVVNYPWDTWAKLAADDNWWEYVSREYADIVHANSPSGYLTDLDNGITNGYAWYSISGGRQDYMNYFKNCREVTLELSAVKLPPESQLNNFWNYNYQSLLAYMKQSLFGFSGIVTNAYNGNPLNAKVFIENHEEDNSWVYSHTPVGDYHRPIKAGTYDVTFSAFGCYDQTININIIDDQNLVLDVQLIPIMPLTSDFSSSTTIAGSGTSINFFDDSWGNDIVSWNWTFEGGTPSTSTEENPVGIYYESVGEYDVTLTVSNINGDSDTKIIEDYMEIMDAVIMTNETLTICDAVYYDSGSENTNYSNDEDYTMTFYPETANYSVVLDFIEFDVQNHLYCDYDYLEIYDGIDINAPILGKWCSINGPGKVIASNTYGALTVYFHSNSTITAPGWKAIVSCDSNVGVMQVDASDIIVYPNPSSTNLTLKFEGELTKLKLIDLSGRLLYSSDKAIGGYNISVSNLDGGIYLLSFNYKGLLITKKVLVNK